MQLTIDIPFSESISSLLYDPALATLLALGDVSIKATPSEAQIASDFGLSPSPDWPLAAISAAADGLDVGDDYWLRADPVHLILERDALRLAEPVPLALSQDETVQLLDRLNQHFAQDALYFVVGQSGQWYVKTKTQQHLQTVLPSVAVNQNVHAVMPTGENAAQWRTVFNDLQMLLHEHPINVAREAQHKRAINSLWFSGGGAFPQSQPSQHQMTLMAQTALYQGLANWAKRAVVTQFESQLTPDFFQLYAKIDQPIRRQCSAPTESEFRVLLHALKAGRLTRLTMHIGFYAHTLIVQLSPKALLRFWRIGFWHALLKRQSPTLIHYLKQIDAD